MAIPRPKPNLNESIIPFWHAVNDKKFKLMRCTKCSAWYFPAAYCRFHANEPFYGNMRWEEASGRGKVFAYNIHHRSLHPAFEGPYVYALIELEEGPMFGTNIVGCAPEDVKIGMPVEVVFSQVEEDLILPQFRPSGIVCEPA